MSSSLWPSAVSSLDDSLALYRESLGKLKAATPVDVNEVIEQLELVTEFAADLRALIATEIPGASWKNRAELDALIEEEIRRSAEAEELEERRSRLLALASELERGSIVHRRAIRVEELNQLREQAVGDLRSRAEMDGAPGCLPGPEAREWVAWACGLQEPGDAESLQTLREGFAHLDEFVANLEPNMWVPGKGPSPELPRAPKKPAIKKPQKQARVEPTRVEPARVEPIRVEPPRVEPTRVEPARVEAARVEPPPRLEPNRVEAARVEPNGFDESVVSTGPILIKLRAPRFSRGRNGQRVSPAPDQPSQSALQVEAPTPDTVFPTRTDTGTPQTQAPENGRAASATPAIAKVLVEPPATIEPPRPVSPSSLDAQPRVVQPVTVEALRATFAAAVAKTEADHHPHHILGDGVGETNVLPATAKPEGEAFVAKAMRASQKFIADVRDRIEELDLRQKQILVGAVALVLILAVVGTTLLWRLHRKHVRMAEAQAIERKLAEAAENAENKAYDQSTKSIDSDLHSVSPPTKNDKDTKSKDQNAAAKPAPPEQERQAAIEVPRNAPVAKRDDRKVDDVTPKSLTEVAGGLPVPNNVNNIVNNMPVAQPKIATPPPEKPKVLTPVILVHEVPPEYPLQARVSGIHGTVVLQAVIAKNGTVKSVHALSGPPLLIESALEAVRQWHYKPSTLDGKAVEADTQISVSFKGQ